MEFGDGIQWVRGSMLGRGSFGRVYKATVKNSRSRYSCYPSEMAVKSAEVSVSSTLQKEREIMGNLESSPYVITCFGDETTIGDHGLMAFNLLLEYASGGTLADRIHELSSGLSEQEVRAHTRSILRGLNSIHGLGYVHCDLKPDNILLVPSAGSTEFQAKIGDFGLAKRGTKQQSNKKRKRLEPCFLRGTPMYLSPEAVIDYVQEAPSDVWAVGCIVLEMLTGEPVWEGEDAEAILAKIGAGKGLPEIPDEISREARDFLKRCFVRNPMFRFTCEMLLSHPFLQGLGDDDVEEESEDPISDDCSSELFSDESEEDSFCSSSEEGNEIMSEPTSSQLRVYKRQCHRPVCFAIPYEAKIST